MTAWLGYSVYKILGVLAEIIVRVCGALPWIMGRRKSQFILDRLARGLRVPGKEGPRLWIHAASVGEVRMIPALLSRFGEQGMEIVLTATTPSGRNALDSICGSVWHGILPLDTRAPMHRFLDAVHPDGLLLLETELWPTLINQASALKIPIMMANARMSGRGRKRYELVRSMLEGLLQKITLCLARSQEDLDRFIELGLPKERGRVAGDLKRDLSSEDLSIKAERLLGPVESGDVVLVAGSIHPGEAGVLGNVFRGLRNRFVNVHMVVVPRHLERLEKIEKMMLAEGLSGKRCSVSKEWGDDGLLYWDRYGDLPQLFFESDIGFIGGSLISHGGHNPLEAARAKVPLLFGPHMENFQIVVDGLVRSGGARTVSGGDDLARELEKLVTDGPLRKTMGQQAQKEASQDQGAAQRIVQAVSAVIAP